MASFQDVLSVFGLSTDIAAAVSRALLEPTSANIGEVTSVYASNGLIPPPKLMAYLVSENEKRYPYDTVRGSIAPYLIGGLVLFLLFFRKRG